MSTGQMRFDFALLDIREFDVDELLGTGRAADCVLAWLAAEAATEFERIVQRVAGLPDRKRAQALDLLLVLSDLRKLPRYVKLELKRMDTRIKLREDGLLMQFRREAIAEGLQSGLLESLAAKFGRVPAWAKERIKAGDRLQLKRWIRKAAAAETIEEVLGPRG